MRKFILTAYKTNKDCFLIDSTEPGIKFYANSLKDLQKTIRCLTPEGYRVRSTQWFSKYMKPRYLDENGILELRNGLLNTKMYEIQEVFNEAPAFKTIPYTNSFNFQHNLKLIQQ